MALQPAGQHGAGLTRERFGPWSPFDHAATTPALAPPAPAAASVSPFLTADRVELSGHLQTSFEAASFEQNGVRVEAGRYTLSARVSFSLSRENGGRPDSRPATPRMEGPLDALRYQVRHQLSRSGSLTGQSIGQYDEVAEWLQGGDPEMMEQYLLLLRFLSETDPEAAERMLQATHSLCRSCKQLGRALSGEGAVARVNFEASISVLRTSASVSGSGSGEDQVQEGDPLVLDLAGDGIDLRSVDDGVRFDLTGEGRRVRSAFVQGDDALLYVDRNQDGRLTDGNELFGDQRGDAHGFDALARHDADANGWIDAADPIFEALRLFQDRNGDGETSAAESRTLPQAGILRLGLGWTPVAQRAGAGGRLVGAATYQHADGRTGLLADALFQYRA